MITEDYVSFAVAKLLKEKGFDWPCHATYDTAITGGKPKFSEYGVLNYFPYGMKNSDDKYSMVISAPTLQKAMKWLRKEELYIMLDFERPSCIEYKIYKYESEIGRRRLLYYNYGDSPEEACETAIKYCLENLI